MSKGWRAAVDAADPVGLLAIDCPPDEYEPEIVRIVPLVLKSASLDELRHGIHAIFVQMFDPKMAGPVAAYQSLAEALWRIRMELGDV